MKERPIIFSGPMVRAILADRKTQTRRVIKTFKAPIHGPVGTRTMMDCIKDWDGLPSVVIAGFENWDRCPYGEPGDRLYVRETWGLPPAYDPEKHGDLKSRPTIGPVCYGADYLGLSDKPRPAWEGGKWRPSIHMPKWAARIWLEVVKTRVERLQDITEADSLAEGIDNRRMAKKPTDDYRELWDKLNAKRGYPWSANPWVWVIEFKQIERCTV